MKVLFISAVFSNEANGAARFAQLVHKNGGNSFTILSEDTSNGPRTIKVEAKPNFFQKKLWQYFRVKYYRKQLEQLQQEYDLFVFNNPVLAYRFKTDKPVFVCVHDEKFMKVHFSMRFDYLRNLFLRRIEKKVTESGVHVISNSQYISNRLSNSYTIDPVKMHLLYQGIQMDDKQKPHDLQMNTERIRMIFIKNDYKRGGLIDLITALRKLDSYTFELSVVGPSKINNSELPHSKNVKISLKGIIPNDEVIREIYNHDLMCIPSKFEPLGVAVMEGLAVGVPVVTTSEGGLPEVTDNGKLVWECKASDPESIAQQLKLCIERPKERKEKSEKGREFVHQKFGFDGVVKRLKEILAN